MVAKWTPSKVSISANAEVGAELGHGGAAWRCWPRRTQARAVAEYAPPTIKSSVVGYGPGKPRNRCSSWWPGCSNSTKRPDPPTQPTTLAIAISPHPSCTNSGGAADDEKLWLAGLVLLTPFASSPTGPRRIAAGDIVSTLKVRLAPVPDYNDNCRKCGRNGEVLDGGSSPNDESAAPKQVAAAYDHCADCSRGDFSRRKKNSIAPGRCETFRKILRTPARKTFTAPRTMITSIWVCALQLLGR